ncbi:hypothetical protein [Pedobacter sp.]|uniref:hypothetical protein n=1 Tax=Pedobacter sp. TaxID=1411316 RepID=UPI003C663B17
MTTINIDLARKKGYTRVCRDETIKDIIDLTDEDKKLNDWYLVSTKPGKRSMSDEDLKQLVTEHIECDDQFYDEDDYVSYSLQTIDWKPLADQITEVISKRMYSMPTNILITF